MPAICCHIRCRRCLLLALPAVCICAIRGLEVRSGNGKQRLVRSSKLVILSASPPAIRPKFKAYWPAHVWLGLLEEVREYFTLFLFPSLGGFISTAYWRKVPDFFNPGIWAELRHSSPIPLPPSLTLLPPRSPPSPLFSFKERRSAQLNRLTPRRNCLATRQNRLHTLNALLHSIPV